jgi:hypothetical protein
MRFEKALLEKSADNLMKKADDCFDLAKTQQDTADKQHEIAIQQHSNADQLETSADKLVALGHSLEAEAVEIKGATESVAARTSPSLREGVERFPPAVDPAAPRANFKQ